MKFYLKISSFSRFSSLQVAAEFRRTKLNLCCNSHTNILREGGGGGCCVWFVDGDNEREQ